ncbi:MAG: formate dehydrogenase-O, major subunit [Deltaproteobacteria bacterium]|nr:formate dehydrogenase-O, major subunit [Deltaproteobacteria bacterium]
MAERTGGKLTRRDFLKGTAGVAGTAVAVELVALGIDPRPVEAKALAVPLKKGKEVPSICPYCAVGCGQIVTVDPAAGKILDIQGNPDSPISEGTLCPKGAATYQLVDNPHRWTKVKYRAPGSDRWEEKPLSWAMDRIAERVKETRDAAFNEFQDMPDGKGGTAKKRVMNTYAIASLGGATMDNEWNYIHQKLMHSLGVVFVENQARI